MTSGTVVRAALAAIGAVGNQITSMDALAAGAADALRQAPAGLTPAGAASFLATMAQESAYFRTTQEYGTKLSYDPYRGRTFEQITFVGNYRDFGRWCAAKGLLTDPETFVKNPAYLADYRWAWLGGVWYFQSKGLWAYANRGDHYSVSQGVNRGVGAIGSSKAPLHWAERNAMFKAFSAAGPALLPNTAPPAVMPAPEPPRRRSGEETMLFFRSPEPTEGQAKKDWPTILVPYAFDPIGGWGGKCILKVDWFGRGGWLKAGQWWVRDPNWSANRPIHFDVQHPVGAGGSERFVGYGWETAPPRGADSIQITCSAPDGVVVQCVYEK